MLLNNIAQNFYVQFSYNTFYPEVEELWKPVVRRMFLPYLTLEDFFMAQITSISFPSISTQTVQQSNQMYNLVKRGGKQIDHTMSKTFSLGVKLSESYMTYFMARQQMELYLKLGEDYKDMYFPPISVVILDDGGFETITYTYYELTPNALSDFELSFQQKAGQFSTFNWSFDYNYIDIYYRDPDTKESKHLLNPQQGMLQKKDLDLSKVPANQKGHILSRETQLAKLPNGSLISDRLRRK